MEKGTEDTSKLVQIEEVKCAIEKLPIVTVLSPVRAVKGKGRGYGVTLRCLLAKNMVAVERNKSHQFMSPACTQRRKHACRSC